LRKWIVVRLFWKHYTRLYTSRMQNTASRRAETASSLLATANVSRLDAEVLLAFVLGKERSWLLAHDDEVVAPSSLQQFQDFLQRRGNGEPLAYITGEKEFYGRMFHVDRRVMIPRPSTEGVVEMVLGLMRENHKSQITHYKQISNSKFQMIKVLDAGICGYIFLKPPFAFRGSQFAILDVGTGSGCIAITLALELPGATIIASDISQSALDVACLNARRHGVLNRIAFLQAAGLPAYPPTCLDFLLVSNPPYLCLGKDEDPSIRCEPREALFAGPYGLDVLLPLVRQARIHPQCMGFVVECLEEQVDALSLPQFITETPPA